MTIEIAAAIRTRYHGPTNTGGTRISVVSGPENRKPRRLFVAWDYSLNSDQNHAVAAQAWLDKFNEFDATVDGPGLYFGGDYFFTWKLEG